MVEALPFDGWSLLDASPNAYTVVDRDLRYLWANAAYLRVVGVGLHELRGRRITERFPHDVENRNNESARRLEASLTKVLRTGAPDVLPVIPYALDDGSTRLWSASHTPVRDAAGAVVGVLQHTVDVTQAEDVRRQAPSESVHQGVLDRASQAARERLLADARVRRLLRVLDQAPALVAVLTGPQHEFVVANASFRQLVGDRVVPGRTVAEAIPEAAGQGFVALLDEVLRTGQPHVGKAVPAQLRRAADGPLVTSILDFTYQPIVEDDGSVSGVFVLAHDITECEQRLRERDRALEELQQRNEFEEQLIAIVSHDLRGPLNVISLAAPALLASPQLEPQHRNLVGRIVSATDRASRLIRDLLDFSVARRGGMVVRPVDADVGALVRASVDEVLLAYGHRDVAVEHHGDATADVDADRMAQVVSNLVGNALQHTPPDASVKVTSRVDDKKVVIEVWNGGPPIPDDDRKRLFQPFQRGAGKGAVSRARSVGLGLHIAASIVAAHHGSIEVTSTAAAGTTFKVCFPRRLEAPTP